MTLPDAHPTRIYLKSLPAWDCKPKLLDFVPIHLGINSQANSESQLKWTENFRIRLVVALERILSETSHRANTNN